MFDRLTRLIERAHEHDSKPFMFAFGNLAWHKFMVEESRRMDLNVCYPDEAHGGPRYMYRGIHTVRATGLHQDDDSIELSAVFNNGAIITWVET